MNFFSFCLILFFIQNIIAKTKLAEEKDIPEKNFLYIRYCYSAEENKNVWKCLTKNDPRELFDYNDHIYDQTYKYLNMTDGFLRKSHLLNEKNPAEIKEMYFGDSSLKFIENEIFDNFISLKILSICDTNLTNIDEKILTEKVGSHLRTLRLNNNSFVFISPSTFKYLFNLYSLDLDENRNIGKLINNGMFSVSLKKLETLSLIDCGISFLDDKVFANLKNLNTLSLAKNPISSIPKAINYLPKLLSVQFTYTNITSIKRDKNIKNKSLSDIMIARSNQLVEIGDCAFCNFPSLALIYLSLNPNLSNIHENAFGTVKDLPELMEIEMDSCNISSLPRKLLTRKVFIFIPDNPLKNVTEYYQFPLIRLKNRKKKNIFIVSFISQF